MFGFLKKKLGDVISKFTEKVKGPEPKEAEEPAENSQPAPVKTQPVHEAVAEKHIEEHKPAVAKIPELEVQHKPEPPQRQAVAAEERKEEKQEKAEPKKGLFERITSAVTGAVTTTKISEGKFDEMFEELELTLLENNVAVEVIGKIKNDLKESLVESHCKEARLRRQ